MVIDGSRAPAVPAVPAITEALAAAMHHARFPHLELTGADTPAIGNVGPLGASRPRLVKRDITADELVESAEQRIIQDIWPDSPISLISARPQTSLTAPLAPPIVPNRFAGSSSSAFCLVDLAGSYRN